MTLTRHSGGGIILLTFIAALILTIIPLPEAIKTIRPEFIALVLIYWCLALPDRVGVGIGWLAGIFLDVAKGTLLGENALALAVIAWVTLNLHKRIRVFPRWQQALSVLLIIMLYQMIILWIRGTIGQSPQTWTYWIPSVTSMVLWPPTYLLLRNLRRSFKVT